MQAMNCNSILRKIAGIILLAGVAVDVFANPTGMTVVSGSATAQQNGSQLNVTTSQSAFLNWSSFNIQQGETTTFIQPSASSVVFNNIGGASVSQIYGNLQANGIVVLMNPSGFYFGPDSFVQAAGLVVSTAQVSPPQNGGGAWEFNGPPPQASIVNFGKIEAGKGGPTYFIAEDIENHGIITAPDGNIALAAGQKVLLSDRPDGRGVNLQVTLPSGSVDNDGKLIADAGTISANANVVNQNGLIQADSVQNQNGVIELVASDQLNLGASSQISASGDNSAAGSSGGTITLKSENNFSDSAGSEIITTGGSQGGNGGSVEISAPNMQSLNSGINARAQAGWTAGTLLLDPGFIILDDSGSGSAGDGTVLAGSSPSGTLDLNVNSAFANIAVSQITLQAVSDITLAGGTTWDLSGTIGANFGGVTDGQLTLEAGRNIIFGDGSLLTDENSWSVTLDAGYNFVNNTISSSAGNIYLNGGNGQAGSGSIQTASGSINLNAGGGIQIGSGIVSSGSGNITWQAGSDIQFGDGSQIGDGNNGVVTLDAGYNFASSTVNFNVGNIYLDGGPNGDGVGGSIQAAAGDINSSEAINLVAGQDITVGSGYVITTAGGSINAHALAGNIDTGSDAQGYHFINNAGSLNSAYNLSDGLGGISTEAGGDVNLTAGGDVASVLPGKGVYYYDGNQVTPGNGNDYLTAGSGAYGSKLGNVTVVAGGNVSGNYLVANGTGGIFAGVEMDANGNPVKDLSGNYVMGSSGNAGVDLGNNGLALTLISGGWNVSAAQNILLQEVRNPNGDFNGSGAFSHYFNYAPGDFVDLSAGNLVQLGSSVALPRLSLSQNNLPVIYPSILNITAGDGGVILGTGTSPNSLILFPSPQGGLTIDTTGSLVSDLNAVQNAPQLFNLIVSDAGHNQYTTTANFGINDHAASPIHAGNPTPISLDIGGDMNLVFLAAPEAAQINVGGNMNNCGFQGMNLSLDPSFQNQVEEADGSTRTFTVSPGVTSINVTGDINNRSAFTSITLSLSQSQSDMQIQDMAYLSQAINNSINGTSISAATLAASLFYNPTTQTLTYQNQNISGVTVAQILNLLQNLTVQKVNSKGEPLWLDSDDTIPDTEQVSVLTPAMAGALLVQYNALGAPPVDNAAGSSIGYTIGGGGQFDFAAQSIDLGTSAGIQSDGAGLYRVGGLYPLANLFGDGANISINVTGDLTMYSTSIASLNGGNIYINADGNINAGSPDFSVSTQAARGIYSTGQGDVAVYANGNINVNGSRIANYDLPRDGASTTPGGSVTVVSRNGDVNAGDGSSGFVNVSSYEVDSGHNVTVLSQTIPGSGILDASFTLTGNILVETPNGNVNAGASGIIQLLLNTPPLPPSTTLFQLPIDSLGLGKMFRLALDGHAKQAVDFQTILNGSPGNTEVDIYAGKELQELDGFGNPMLDSFGNPVVTASDLSDGTLVKTSDNRDVNATGSGVIGAGTVTLDASGDVTGNIFALNNVNINAADNINVNVFGLGNVSVNSAGGTISGTIIGVGGVSASGSSIDANLESNGSVTGATSGQSGLAQGTAANATSQSASNDDSAKAAASSSDTDDEKKKGKQIALAQKVSRVTVILPAKNKP